MDTSSSNQGVFSTVVAPVVGQTYVLAGKLDFDSDTLALWVNPEASGESTPALVVAYDGDDWSSGIMFTSSADGTGAEWDDVEVGDVHMMDLPGLEPRGAVIADLSVRGEDVRIVGVHLGLLARSRARSPVWGSMTP